MDSRKAVHRQSKAGKGRPVHCTSEISSLNFGLWYNCPDRNCVTTSIFTLQPSHARVQQANNSKSSLNLPSPAQLQVDSVHCIRSSRPNKTDKFVVEALYIVKEATSLPCCA